MKLLEKLITSTINNIQEVRENFEKFQCYDRAVIVSALSLVHFQKFDEKKANLLLLI